MAKNSSEIAIEGLKKLLDSVASNGGKGETTNETEGKIKKLIAELEEPHHHDPAVERIIDGFRCFKIFNYNMYPEFYDKLKEGQHPKFLVFACSDSRVSPSHVLKFQPGEAFMARNIANLVPPFDKVKYSGPGAIIEYAVTQLKVENILVIGHSRCGGIKRLMEHPEDHSPPFDFVDDWVHIAIDAKNRVNQQHPNCPLEKRIQICEKEAVKVSLEHLKTYPYVKSAWANGRLALRGGHYNFVDGTFMLWEEPPHGGDPIIIH